MSTIRAEEWYMPMAFFNDPKINGSAHDVSLRKGTQTRQHEKRGMMV